MLKRSRDSNHSIRTLKLALRLFAAIRKSIQPNPNLESMDGVLTAGITAHHMSRGIGRVCALSNDTFSLRQATGVSSYHELIEPCCQALINDDRPSILSMDLEQMSLAAMIAVNSGLVSEPVDAIMAYRVVSLSAVILRRATKDLETSSLDKTPCSCKPGDVINVIEMWAHVLMCAADTKSTRYNALALEFLDADVVSFLGYWSLSPLSMSTGDGALSRCLVSSPPFTPNSRPQPIASLGYIMRGLGDLIRIANVPSMTLKFVSQINETSLRTIETGSVGPTTVALWEAVRDNLKVTIPRSLKDRVPVPERPCDRPGCDIATVNACGRCLKVVYCSTQCQRSCVIFRLSAELSLSADTNAPCTETGKRINLAVRPHDVDVCYVF